MKSKYRITFHYMYLAYDYVENTIWQTDSFESLNYSFNANDVTEATVVLHPDADIPSYINSRNICMRIWRKPDEETGYQLEGGTEWLVMRVVKTMRPAEEGGTTYTITAYHPLIAFRRRVIAYKADTVYADKQDYPSIMMFEYIGNNVNIGGSWKVVPGADQYVYLQSQKTLTRSFTTPAVGIYSAKLSQPMVLRTNPSPNRKVLKLARNFTVPEVIDKIYFQGTSTVFLNNDFVTIEDSVVGFLTGQTIEGNETKFDFTRIVGSANTTFQTNQEVELDSYHLYLEGGALFFAENDLIRLATISPYTSRGTVTITRGTTIAYTVMNLVSSATINTGNTFIYLRGKTQYFRANDEVTLGSGNTLVTGKITAYIESGNDQRWTFTWVSGATGQTYASGSDVRNNSNNGREQRWMFTYVSGETNFNIPKNSDAENTKYDIYVSLTAGDPLAQKFNAGDYIRLRIINFFDPQTLTFPYPGYKEVWGQVTNPFTVSASEQRWTFSLISGTVGTVFKFDESLENTVWNFGTEPLPSVAGSWQNLLRTLQDLAAQEDKAGNRTYFQFTSFAGEASYMIRQNYLNADRRADVKFSLKAGNLSEVVLTSDFEKEVNVVYAGGSGSGAAQAVEELVADSQNRGTAFFRSEEYQTFADLDGQLLLQEGKRHLAANRAKLTLRARVEDIPSCRYGVHYQHGDLVTVVTDDGTFDCHVYAVSVSVREDSEDVEVYLDAQRTI